MALRPGTRFGPYVITAQIGVGGMGEVYRARDENLGRDVAIKVLPEIVAHDADRRARFEREAKTLASLDHPNIATIHGLEKSEGTHALVMELVEGPTLAERLAEHKAQGRTHKSQFAGLPIKEGLTLARQIADALDAAHERGIVHRDLKPANIGITPEGVVKVLDFGLATAVLPDLAGRPADRHDETHTPTVTDAATQKGVIVGTAAYMSPEQARGHVVDKRTDIWAFGCVLYEVLTGRAPFAGETLTDTLAAVIEREPDWSLLPTSVPTGIARMLRRCLAKDLRMRLRDIGDARAELDEVAEDIDPSTLQAERPRIARRSRLQSGLVAAGLIAAIAGTAWFVSRNAGSNVRTDAGELRLEITTPLTDDAASLAISPDGDMVVFAGASSDDSSQLWLRELSADASRPLPGTEGGRLPFWSPDGGSIGFFADSKLKRIDLAGGGAHTLADAPNPQGGTWTRDDTILFTPTQISPISRVAASGGTSMPLTQLEGPQLGHLFPQMLPGDQHVLYFASGPVATRGIYVVRRDGSNARRLMESSTRATSGTEGRFFFVRDASLFAQAFNPDAAALIGNPIRVAEGVATGNDAVAISASAAGPIVYRASSAGDRQLVWYDKSGNELTRLGAVTIAGQQPALSPDGRSMALSRTVDGSRDIWLLDLNRTVFSRFTFDSGLEMLPVWSPDGARILFSSPRSGVLGIYQKRIGGGAEEPVMVGAQNTVPSDVSRDGRVLLYGRADPNTLLDLWAMPLDTGAEPFPVVQSAREDLGGQFAPGRDWLAYQSNESGRYEISLRRMRGGGAAVQVSIDGGTQPRWREDGRELYYLDLNRRLMAVSIALAADGGSVDVGRPSPLFQTRIGGANITQKEYLVAPDGQRFLLDTPIGNTAPPIRAILNWQPPS